MEDPTLPQATGTMRLELDLEEGVATGSARLGEVVVSTLRRGHLDDCSVGPNRRLNGAAEQRAVSD